VSDPFLAEIRVTSFNFAPKGWALCNGQLLPINQNQALFALLGTTYGGDGRVNFALPDLRGRAAVHAGTLVQGSQGGTSTVTLTSAQLPAHAHALYATSTLATSASPAGALLAAKPRSGRDIYAPPANVVGLNAAAVANAGGTQPHDNMQPYLVLNFIIALQGIFPSRN
jgi:microcystin-dependent protein